MNITPACFGNKDPETTACSGCEWEATCGLGILGQLKRCRSELSTLKAEVLSAVETIFRYTDNLDDDDDGGNCGKADRCTTTLSCSASGHCKVQIEALLHRLRKKVEV